MKQILIITLLALGIASKSQANQENYFASYNISNDNPIGIKLGLTNFKYNSGLYLSLNFGSPNFGLDSDFKLGEEINKIGRERSYTVTNETQKEAYSFLLGLNTEVYENSYIYYGVGYGKYFRNAKIKYQFLNDTDDGHYWAEDEKNNSDGIAIEFGGIYKYNRVLFSAGMSSLSFDRYDFQIGIGLFF
jgi:hypothetical protein